MTNKQCINLLNIQAMLDHLAFGVVECIVTEHISEMQVLDVWLLAYRVEPLNKELANKLNGLPISNWVVSREIITMQNIEQLAAFIVKDYENVKTSYELAHTLFDLLEK